MLCAFDFNKTNADEISCRRGDILLIEAPVRLPSGCLTTISTDNCTDRWLSARDWRNGNVGLVPADFLTDESGESVVFDAFQCSSRAEAEEQLLLPVIQSGTFIVRPAKEVGNLTLSVLVREESNAHVEHYHLHYDAASQGYYISSDKKLGSLDELIKFYCDPQTCTLTVPLCAPCPKLGHSVQKFSSCVVSRASVALKHRLSSGNFGEVWLATYRGVEVAVKRALAATSRQDIVKEAEVMHQLYHPRLVLFLGVCCEPSSEPVMIITEFMPNGALDGYLRQKRPLYGELLDMIFQISDGMAYLERRRAVHNDLRAANILVDADNSVKVADFGLTKILCNDSRDICDGMFPVRWTPPEATEVGVFQSTKSDVWSFGVLMYEVFTYGGVPYDDIPDDNEVIVAVENGHRLCNPSELGYQCEDRIYAKMQACWDSDPETRPTFEELYHFFKPSDAALL
ncbi:tyrosine protein kinase Fyn [Echinococcus multilocularis]|uniref:Tyrosine-protein kinase n=1 Tax=Echinococcus multilocularis TaxID=6211 RepID=A0A0S4MN49_ECHMU|nr:tyrosine protein kinase Fyn [Echinococcus multilocularis]